MMQLEVDLHKNLIIAKKLITINIQAGMEYRTNYILVLLATFAYSFTFLLFIDVLMTNVGSIAGFSKGEMIILFGFAQVWYAIHSTIAYPLSQNTVIDIINGTFDYYLTIPIKLLYFKTLKHLDILSLISLIPYAGIVFYGVSLLDNKPELINILFAVVLFIIGTITYFMFQLWVTSLAFIYKDIESILWSIIEFEGMDNYPYNIYPKAIRFIGFLIIPVFYIGNIPMRMLVGKGSWLYLVGSIIITVIWTYIALRSWKKGINNYESVGN